MNKYQLHCQEPWFSLLLDRKKKIEGRKNLPKFKDWKVGDLLEFYCGGQSFESEIVDLRRYATIKDYLESESVECALPGIASIEDGLKIYQQWSTPAEVAKYGFLAIEIRALRQSSGSQTPMNCGK